jgi:hypothetical protein
MKNPLAIIFFLSFLFTGFTSCRKETSVLGYPEERANSGTNNPNQTRNKMKIKIGASTFTATLYDNATATAFKARLPITINMRELNGNEKYLDLAASLPTNASNPGTIQNGDLMLYGAKTLVLFYKSFPTTYRYTKLGRINDPAGLAAAVGTGNVEVTFELELNK